MEYTEGCIEDIRDIVKKWNGLLYMIAEERSNGTKGIFEEIIRELL